MRHVCTMSPDWMRNLGLPIVCGHQHSYVLWNHDYEAGWNLGWKLRCRFKLTSFEYRACIHQCSWNHIFYLLYWQYGKALLDFENSSIHFYLMGHRCCRHNSSGKSWHVYPGWSHIDRWDITFHSNLRIWYGVNTLDHQLRDLSIACSRYRQFTVSIHQLVVQWLHLYGIPHHHGVRHSGNQVLHLLHACPIRSRMLVLYLLFDTRDSEQINRVDSQGHPRW